MRNRGGKFADRGRPCSSGQAQSRLSAQSLLHILAVVDIDQQAVPASHSAFIVTRGLAERAKPPVDAIGTAEPALVIVRLAGCDSARPRTHGRLRIVRVKEIGPAELRPGVGARAGVVQ